MTIYSTITLLFLFLNNSQITSTPRFMTYPVLVDKYRVRAKIIFIIKNWAWVGTFCVPVGTHSLINKYIFVIYYKRV
jgi:hypothetical protein